MPAAHSRSTSPGSAASAAGAGTRRLQQPEPGQRLDRCAAPSGADAGSGLVAGERRVGDRAEHVGHLVVREAGGGERP